MDKSLDDIFEDDEFGLLDEYIPTQRPITTDEDRLIDAFEELNAFYEKNQRIPSSTSMTEYSLNSRLNDYKKEKKKRSLLEPFDKYHLLRQPKKQVDSIEDIMEDDDSGLLKEEGDSSIFTFKHIPKSRSRKDAEYIATRKPIPEKEFKKYEKMFKKVHQELKNGERKLLPFSDAENNLKQGNFYLVDGLLAYLEISNAEEVLKKNKSGNRVRLEGRTHTIFENATLSNMLFRSLGKAIQKNGKMITVPDKDQEKQLFNHAGINHDNDIESGWIYVLKSQNPQVAFLKNLYKIGLSTKPVKQRIRNAKNEATYLYDEVELIDTFKCYNLNLQVLENLIHRFFSKACLDIDLYKDKIPYHPREWFVIPLPIIIEAIELLKKGTITHYVYNEKSKIIRLKK